MSADRHHAQNEQVVTFTLVELLTQLVFVAMLLAVVLRDEVNEKFADPAREIKELKVKVAKLQQENAQLQKMNVYLMDQLKVRPAGYDPSDHVVPVPAKDLSGYQKWLAGQGKGGQDRPKCTGLPGFVLALQFPSTGIRGTWIGPAGVSPASIPGMAKLASGEPLSKAAFKTAAALSDAWARQQSPPCGLRVRIDAGNMVDKGKQTLVRQYFYESTL